MSDLLHIDGSVLEGGGQILRIAISLSALLCKPIRVTNIRSGRNKPGLADQHLRGILLVADMCGGKVTGAHLGSTAIEFRPGQIRGGDFQANIQTAGSVSLLIQVALPCALYADKRVSILLKGGTHVGMAPQIDYMTEVFRPALQRFNANFKVDVKKRGYFPRGNGEVILEVNPVNKLKNVDITERGTIVAMYGCSYVSGMLPKKMAYTMSDGAKEVLLPLCDNVQIECYKENNYSSQDNSNCINVACQLSSGCVLGAGALGRRGLDPRHVGHLAARELQHALDSGTCVDHHLQDQLILYMALAEGKSVVRISEISLHTKTAIHVVELISQVKFNVIANGNQHFIECEGMGLVNKTQNLLVDT